MQKKSVVNRQIENIYPLTYLQEGMLYHYMLDKESTNYILQTVYTLNKSMDDAKAETALSILALRNAALRTCILYENIEKPHQVVLRERKLEYTRIDFSAMEKEQSEIALQKCLSEDVKKGFDLQRDPLMRVIHILLP